MGLRAVSVRRARRQVPGRFEGFIVTWDADSRDPAQCARLRRFVFGHTSRKGGKPYRYPGFVERDGVRYLGQSVLFVVTARFPEINAFLRGLGVDLVVTRASLAG